MEKREMQIEGKKETRPIRKRKRKPLSKKLVWQSKEKQEVNPLRAQHT